MLKLRIVLCSVMFSYTLQSSHGEEQLIAPGSFLFWIFALISFALSLFAGICSGLTVGYMAINKQQMELWANSDNEEERKMAKPILQVLSNHHLLLSTLLLSNALSLQALPIFLDKIVPGYMAIIISTCAVVVFGQVIPQAYCTGQHKVKIGYYFSGFIKAMEFALYIFVKPIVYVLDNWLGHHDDKIVLDQANLKAILYLHNSRDYGYRPEQIEILQNTMDLRMKLVKENMIKLKDTFSVDQEQIVNEDFIDQLEKVNFSKIPIFKGKKDNIVGYMKVKNLLCFNLSQSKKLKGSEVITPILKINQTATLLQAIDLFKSNKTNFAAVISHETKKCLGIITLKQIFEKLVLKQFKDNDVRMNINFNQNQGVLDQIVEGKQQD